MSVYIHLTAEVAPGATVGQDTKVWNQAQLREGCIVGDNCNIGKNCYIDFDVKIGNRVKVQNNVSIFHGVQIEVDVFIGPSVTFTNDFYPRAYSIDWEVYPTVVKKGASIGANATIVCGHTIGEYAMVGAGSVVTQDVPPFALVVGNPARQIGWVCKCGNKLDDAGHCLKCGHYYDELKKNRTNVI